MSRAQLLALIAGALVTWPRLALAQAPSLPPGAYVLDTGKARLTAKMSFLGVGHFTTRFLRLSGGFTYDPQRAGSGELSIQVDPRSMDNAATSSGRQMLASFEPDRYPTITFVARQLTLSDRQQTLAGDLTLHGVTRPLTLSVTFKGVDGDMEQARAAFAGAGRIRRSEFGITNMRGVVGDRVDLAFDVEFVRR